MTDRVKSTLGRWSTALGIIVILVGFVAYMTRALDASTQAVQAIEKMNVRLDVETYERTKADKENAAAIASEREERKADNTNQLVKLAEIDTKLFYLQQGQDQILSYMNNERNAR